MPSINWFTADIFAQSYIDTYGYYGAIEEVKKEIADAEAEDNQKEIKFLKEMQEWLRINHPDNSERSSKD